MGVEDLPNSVSLEFVEALYADFLRDPKSVAEDWRTYFQRLSEGNGFTKAESLTPSFKSSSIFNPPEAAGNGAVAEEATTAVLQERIDQLIRNYRVRGHMAAQLDPLGIPRATPPELDLDFYGLTEADMNRLFACEAMCA
jgi:2-oxoglutarate dehydrogenase E1 component